MSLWRHPRTAAALCIAAVLDCAAAPAAFLAASDAAYFGRVETVADPYRAPTPTADDYYILRQLAARGQDTTARQTTPQQEQDAAPQTPKVYIGASASIESMTWADTAATTAAAFLDKLMAVSLWPHADGQHRRLGADGAGPAHGDKVRLVGAAAADQHRRLRVQQGRPLPYLAAHCASSLASPKFGVVSLII